jgi:hypothetical protein
VYYSYVKGVEIGHVHTVVNNKRQKALLLLGDARNAFAIHDDPSFMGPMLPFSDRETVLCSKKYH